jgi:hypothetical protein
MLSKEQSACHRKSLLFPAFSNDFGGAIFHKCGFSPYPGHAAGAAS